MGKNIAEVKSRDSEQDVVLKVVITRYDRYHRYRRIACTYSSILGRNSLMVIDWGIRKPWEIFMVK